MDRSDLEKVISDQRGLFTREQARGCGYSTYQIRRRRTAGEWRTIVGDVMARAGTPTTPRVRDLAVQLAVPGGVLAGPSAARWYGMEIADSRTYLLIAQRRKSLPGFRYITGRVADLDVCRIENVYLTSRARTVFDCLRLLPERDSVDLLDRALQKRWITMAELAGRTTAFAGRRGAPRLVRMVRHAAAGTRSEAERLAATLLRRAGIGGWVGNDPIEDHSGLIGVGDLVFRKHKLVVELDGRAHHSSPAQFQRDRERQNRLVADGWTVLRFTWYDLTTRPHHVVATIQAMLARLDR